jgi:pimeloyl-ACP methyl ester carboxylesterase
VSTGVDLRPEIGNRVLANGIATNYLEAGEGDPVVLVHGSGPGVSAYANWRLSIPTLSRKLRVFAPDMVGFGSPNDRRASTTTSRPGPIS